MEQEIVYEQAEMFLHFAVYLGQLIFDDQYERMGARMAQAHASRFYHMAKWRFFSRKIYQCMCGGVRDFGPRCTDAYRILVETIVMNGLG